MTAQWPQGQTRTKNKISVTAWSAWRSVRNDPDRHAGITANGDGTVHHRGQLDWHRASFVAADDSMSFSWSSRWYHGPLFEPPMNPWAHFLAAGDSMCSFLAIDTPLAHFWAADKMDMNSWSVKSTDSCWTGQQRIGDISEWKTGTSRSLCMRMIQWAPCFCTPPLLVALIWLVLVSGWIRRYHANYPTNADHRKILCQLKFIHTTIPAIPPFISHNAIPPRHAISPHIPHYAISPHIPHHAISPLIPHHAISPHIPYHAT